MGASPGKAGFWLALSFTHLLEYLKDVLSIGLIQLRSILTLLYIRVKLCPCDHFQAFLWLWLLRNQNKRIPTVFKLLKGLEHIFEMRWDEKLSFFLFRFFPEQKQEHKSLQLLPVLILHRGHHACKSLILCSNSLILFHQYLHHRLQFLMLFLQHRYLLLQFLLSRPNRHDHIFSLLFLLFIGGHSLPLYLQEQLSKSQGEVQVEVLEKLMMKDGSFLLLCSQLTESVHIKLADKGEEVGMFEMTRKYFVGQS